MTDSFVDWRVRTRPSPTRGITSDHLFEGDGLIAALVTLDPGAEVPTHVHEHHDEIFDVMSGEGEILLDKTWRPLLPGTTAVVEANQWHALRNPSAVPLVLRETIRQRVYARAALRAAVNKRLPGWLRG
ncbi:MAG: cupin domain-containing protein [Dehalococcoidia bacterium]